MEVEFGPDLGELIELCGLWARSGWVGRESSSRSCPGTESVVRQPAYAQGSTGRRREGTFLRVEGKAQEIHPL